MSVKVSPISRTAAILLIALGAFTLFAGYVAEELTSEVAGVAILALGVFLYWLLFRLTRKIEADFKEAVEP